ncbi:thioesterase family protein [Sphingorhabdus sp. EL138]|uniref:acyl-CoA thioesterase n=1 Tax=Sphingorhabdus sp. EL138 TaxID=2073156 RepID=UPI000D689DE6|nr:acyl-CoA thioesterase [Sphingorhabdus sp. EL138]
MSKPEPWQLSKASYPFSNVTQTRFGDMDLLGHINNVAMAELFENGRVRFNRSMGMENRTEGDRWLIAAVQINYLREAHFPEDAEICSGIGRIGNSSWDILSAAFQGNHCVATCTTTLVLTNPEGAKVIDGEFRAVLEAQMVRRG